MIELVPHIPRWAEDFERARLALAEALGDDVIAIEHIGSTAIPGIVAKPIIDIAVAVSSFEDGAGCVARIEALGYRYRGENGIPRRHYFVKGDPADIHLHMFEAAGEQWRRHIAFRDHLRRNPGAAAEYSRLKLALAAECGDDRPAYTERKGPFITAITDRALGESVDGAITRPDRTMEPMPPLRLGRPGGRAILRDWTLDDIPVWESWLDPANDWYRTDGPFHPPPTPEEIAETIGRVREMIGSGTPPTPRVSLVIADPATDLLIGRVSRYWQDRHSDWLSLGISIYDPARRGEGIGFEALGLWTDYLFASFPEISRLDLRTWSGNIGMMRLAEKLGYLREGCFRDARRVGGLHYDALAYGILRREWEERRERG